MSVPPFNVCPMEILTQMAPFEAQLSPKDGSESFFLRVFALDTRMAIEKLIVNLPLDWQGDIELSGESVARRFFIYPRLVCESMEQI